MRIKGEQKAETRERIIAAASHLFRAQGIDGVGVDAVMRAAGLTHGGFYAHFASKEALVAEVSAASLARSAARWERISEEEEPAQALATIVRNYLDPVHVTATEHGCVLATLGPEVARRSGARPAMTASIRRMLDVLAGFLPRRRQQAAEALSAMVGAIVLARLCDDQQLAHEFLAAGRRVAGLCEQAPD